MEIGPSRSPPEPSSGVGPSSTTPLRNAWKVPTPQEIEAVNQQNRFNQLVAQQQAAELAADKKGKREYSGGRSGCSRPWHLTDTDLGLTLRLSSSQGSVTRSMQVLQGWIVSLDCWMYAFI